MNIRLFILALGAFVIGTDGFIVAGILFDISFDLKVSIAAVGQLVTVFALTVAIASPVLATITSNVSPKNILFLTMLIFSIGNFISFLSDNFYLLMISRVIAALGAALYIPVATSMAANMVPENQQGKAIALVSTGLTVAITLGVPLGTWVGNYLGWRITFLAVSILGAIICVVIKLLLHNGVQTNVIKIRERLSPFKQLPIIAFLISGLGNTIGSFAMYTYITPVLNEISNYNYIELSIMIALFGVSSLIGAIFGGICTDKFGSIPTIILTLSIKFIALSSFSILMKYPGSSLNLILAPISIIVWGITAWMLSAPLQKYLVILAPRSTSIVLALSGSFLYIGTALGAILGGLIIENHYIKLLGLACGVSQLVSLVLIWITVNLFKNTKKMNKEIKIL